MNNKLLPLVLLGLLALVQLYVPASMIFEREEVLDKGRGYQFALEPVDPSDPFRGKYLTLYFRHDTLAMQGLKAVPKAHWGYVTFRQDQTGFARIYRISHTRPGQTADYLKARVQYSQEGQRIKAFVYFPFDRFYLEESKALPAEKAYATAMQDSSQAAYALVKIKDGKAVLEEVYIDGVPVAEKVKALQKP
ncbi:MAG: GDYXXLXY domain-containing protein [Adhaeribacter sp.]